jgi:hypothetical protein
VGSKNIKEFKLLENAVPSCDNEKGGNRVQINRRSPTGGWNQMKSKPRIQNAREIAKHYEPTPEEQTALKSAFARRVKTPRVKVTETNGRTELSLDHPVARQHRSEPESPAWHQQFLGLVGSSTRTKGGHKRA